MDIYAQNILDRYKKPFHKGKVISATIKHGEANHSCGDTVEIELELVNEKIKNYSFSGNGCAISMASADILGDLAEEMTSDEILSLSKENIYEMLGIEISLRRSKCALLSLMATQNAILGSLKKKPITWTSYHL